MQKKNKIGRLILFVCIVISLSCNSEVTHPEVDDEILYQSGDEIRQVTYDGHEYLILDGIRSGGICHKANCKYCKE